MGLYFTSDPHYDDYNILGYAGRNFENVESMNSAMIKNCNTKVGLDDTLIIIGDFCIRDSMYLNFYKNLLSRLKCKKKILVLGNHDKLDPFQYIDVGFYSVHTHLEMTLDGIETIIIHDPSHSCMDRSKLFLCGHTHDFMKVRKNVICLCVELWNYFPVSWDTLKELYIEMKNNNFNITR